MFLIYGPITLLLCLFGAIIMGLEILSSSLMAPYFGGSVYVWGSIISSFMVNMSAGYVLGGYIAKKVGKISVLIWLLILGSIGTMIIPSVHRPLCEFITNVFTDVRLGSLIAMTILSLPIIIMAMVSPYIIGIFSRYNSSTGFTAGLILLASTFGSFIGTNITAFYLIDLFPVSKIISRMGIIGVLIPLALLFLKLDQRLALGLNKK